MARSDTTKARVAMLMDRVPGAADDDRVLYLAYLMTFCGIKIPQELFRDIVHRGEIPESVFRRRREILEERRGAAVLRQ